MKISFKNRSVSEILEPRPHRDLPSLGQICDEHSQTSSLLTPHPQDSAAKAAEVMQKSFKIMLAQHHANGFTDEDIRKAREADVVAAYAEASKEINPDDEMEDDPDEGHKANPYQDRADVIGLSHRIPGIGHLGELLAPPGWSPGDEPIPIKRARQLQKEAYDAAKKRLADSISDFQHLKGAAFEEASDLNNEEWQNQSELTKLIFEERVQIYKAHQERKEQQPQAGEVLPWMQSSGLHLPYPTLSSMQDLTGGVTKPTRYVYGRHASGADALSFQNGLASRSSASLDQSEPSPRVISPSFLDPSLIPGTVNAVLQNYHAKKTELDKLQLENELQLQQCLTKYGPPLGLGHPPAQQAQSVPRFLGPDFDTRQRTQPTSECLPYCAAQTLLGTGNDGANGNGNGPEEDIGPTTYHYASPPSQHGLGIYEDREDEPVELAWSSPSKQSHEEQNVWQLSQSASETTDKPTAPLKSRAGRKGTSRKDPTASRYAREKKPVWYASHLETVNIPTSSLSGAAIQAGLDYDPNAPPTPKVDENGLFTTTKKRRRSGDEVPVPESRMPAEKIRGMFASGLPIKYVGRGPNPFAAYEAGKSSMEAAMMEPAPKKKCKGRAKAKAAD
ncbi:MAG: hypothetical protein Q9200_005771, partial [Gallowayella weberi]